MNTTPNETTLLPCPFCNSTNVATKESEYDPDRICCEDCGAHGPESFGGEQVTLWNTRAPHGSNAPTQDAVEAMQRAFNDADEADCTLEQCWKAALAAAYPALVKERDAYKNVVDKIMRGELQGNIQVSNITTKGGA